MRTMLLNDKVSVREMCIQNTYCLKYGPGTIDRYLFKIHVLFVYFGTCNIGPKFVLVRLRTKFCSELL